MDNYVIDVPVRITIWVRPELFSKQWEVIKQARPSILFIQSDGGRNENETTIINETRKMVDNEIDWDCKVFRFYESNNLGMYMMWKKVNDFIWNTVDYCVMLEDDIVPTISFFKYCEHCLKKYLDDPRIEYVCGMNHLGIYEKPSSDYFFSRQGSIWGFGTWKRVAKDREIYQFRKDKYALDTILHNAKKNKTIQKRIKGYAKSDIYEGHIPGSEFWFEFDIYARNRVCIVPKYNLIQNIGCTEKSTHTSNIKLLPKKLQTIFNLKTYELDFPLREPEYVVPDGYYEKKRNQIMAYNCPVRSFFRKIEHSFRIIRYGGFSKLLKMIKNKNKRER